MEDYARQYAKGMMGDEEAFHASMAAHPDDTFPPLVYADWLEDHDRPTQAELIRRHTEGHNRDPVYYNLAGTHGTYFDDIWPLAPGQSVVSATHPSEPAAAGIFLQTRNLANPSRNFTFALRGLKHDDVHRLLHGLVAEGAIPSKATAKFYELPGPTTNRPHE